MNAPAPDPTSPSVPAPVARSAWGLLLGLLVECVLGIGLNVSVQLPSSPSVTQVFLSIPLLTAHILIGFLLVIGSAFSWVLVRRTRVEGLGARAGLVLVFVTLALVAGFAYVFTQTDAFADGMAVAFVLALISQVLVLLRVRSAQRASSPASAP